MLSIDYVSILRDTHTDLGTFCVFLGKLFSLEFLVFTDFAFLGFVLLRWSFATQMKQLSIESRFGLLMRSFRRMQFSIESRFGLLSTRNFKRMQILMHQ